MGAGGACIEDGLYSFCFHGTLASEGENTYKSAAIDLLRQTNSYVCYMKGLLTNLRLEAEVGGERRNIALLGRSSWAGEREGAAGRARAAITLSGTPTCCSSIFAGGGASEGASGATRRKHD